MGREVCIILFLNKIFIMYTILTFFFILLFFPRNLIKRIRIFSKALKPLAILSYHRDSIYSLAFSRIFEQEFINQQEKSDDKNENVGLSDKIVKFGGETTKHYLVGGSKDHRISLWEIY